MPAGSVNRVHEYLDECMYPTVSHTGGPQAGSTTGRTALVTTCYREADHIDAFLDALAAQTQKPDEVIIVDAGSKDGTTERIEERIRQGLRVTLIVEPGANRSRGRNVAVQTSSADIIAVTDVGSCPLPDWFELITAPLIQDSSVDVVGGYYAPNPTTLWQAAVAAATVPTVNEVRPDAFLPSARSIAFRRRAWQKVGGYPEWACHNEDTPFDLALRASGARFVFEPRAIVEWRPHTRVGPLFVQFYRYAWGDAQGRIWFRHYTKCFTMAAAGVLMVALSCIWWPAWFGGAAALVTYWLRHALRASRRTKWRGAAWIAPLANLIVDAAHVAGYCRGLLDRKVRKRAT